MSSQLVARRGDLSTAFPFDEHDQRYAAHVGVARCGGRLLVAAALHAIRGSSTMWRTISARPSQPLRAASRRPRAPPTPDGRPTFYAGGESETAKNLIAAKCDAYLMHGDDPPHDRGAKIADMRARSDALGLTPMTFGVAGYCIVRDSDAEARREVDAHHPRTQSNPRAGTRTIQQWITARSSSRRFRCEDYSVSNRGLRSGFIGTPKRCASGWRTSRRGRSPGAAAVQPPGRGDGALRRAGDAAMRASPP